MLTTRTEVTTGLGWPRWTPQSPFLQRLRGLLPSDTLLLGRFHRRQPRIDEVLTASHLEDAPIKRWLAHLQSNGHLLDRAAQQGRLLLEDADAPERGAQATLLLCLPETDDADYLWTMVLARQERDFSAAEQKMAGLLLSQLRIECNQQDEPGMGKMLIGQDDRPIHIDPYTQARLIDAPDTFKEFVAILHTVARQRWPEVANDSPHEFATVLADQSTWVSFQQRRALPDQKVFHWYVELRPLEPDELPIVGSIEDERIARAIGYLHDHFDESPSLSQVSEAVHVSPFHFHRLFSRAVGVSPKQYLQRKQLQMARWLLRSSRVPIGTIATATGFSSHGHFTATFHRVVGMSPTQYREREAG